MDNKEFETKVLQINVDQIIQKFYGNTQIGKTVEIESTGEERVQEGLKMLGLEGKDAGDKNITEIYQEI